MKSLLVSHVYHAQIGRGIMCGLSSPVQSSAVRSMCGVASCLVTFRTLRLRECALCAGVDTGSCHSEWPWVFEEPGRSAELLAEEMFDGFGGLDELLSDDLEVAVNEAYGTVNSQVRVLKS